MASKWYIRSKKIMIVQVNEVAIVVTRMISNHHRIHFLTFFFFPSSRSRIKIKCSLINVEKAIDNRCSTILYASKTINIEY